jgi:superfamily II DNA/RNA helicase
MDFTELGLHPDLLDGIDALNFTQATPIQEQAIPLVMQGKDVIGVAQTGTGKTAAFVLPILNAIMESETYNVTQALIIVPTRELAMQIDQAISAYSYFSNISSMAVYGGGDGKVFIQEKSALTSGADIIIATPGRLIAHIKMGYVDFSKINFLVLDEADRMLDMGFKPDLLRIIDIVNPVRQTLLFSATMPKDVLKLAKSLTKDAVSISIALSKPAEGVSQGVYMVNDRQKLPLILDILKDIQGQRIIIFSSTKQGVNTLFQQLKAKRLNVESVSSDLDQEKRESVMLAFRNSQVDIIVATDVLSRGIDIDGIDMVINYDIPRDAEDYVHRIGRTARAQRKGAALTLVSPADLRSFKKIEQLIGKEVPRLPLPPHVEAMKNDPVRDNRRPAEKSFRQPAADNRAPRPGQPQRTNARPNQPERPTAQPNPPERLQSRLPQPDPTLQATNNTDPNKAKRPKRRKPRPKPRPIPTNEMDQDID